MKRLNRKDIFWLSALALAVLSLGSLFAIQNESGHSAVGAQSVTGWRSQDYHQVPGDGLTGVSGGEVLGYGFKFNGISWDRDRVPNVVKAVSLTAGTAETTIWTPASGKKFRLQGLVLTAGAGTLLTFKDNTAGSTIFTLTVPANTPTQITPALLGNGVLSAAANNVLTVTRGTSATLDGFVAGQEQ
jgi:hypothetical protein